jgi:Tol biopolymer transport system component
MIRSSAAILGGALLIVSLLGWPGAAQAHVVERASVATGGTQGNDWTSYCSISGGGRYLVFGSYSTNLVPGDTNGTSDIFVRDRQTGSTERVSVATGGAQGNDWSAYPSISADGRCVVFLSSATNLVPGDTNGTSDIYVRDRETGATERVNVAGGGAQANGGTYPCAISADGRYVAFSSWASNLVPGDTNGVEDIFIHDRQSATIERVSLATGGSQGNLDSSGCSLSADGRYVAFISYATNLVPGDTNWVDDVFVRDRQTGITERVSVAGDGTQANESSYGPSISADGRYVAFPSDASNLVPGDTNDRRDAFVRDRQAETTALVSVSSTGTKGNLSSGTRSISADGRYVAFISYATNLVPGDTNWVDDVFVRDLQTGTTERVSVSAGGNQANRGSILTAAISADGRFVAFESEASNLVSGDTNGVYDVFVAEITPAGFFSDVSSSPYRIAIEGLAQAGVVSGYGDRTFRPLNPVLRAQFAKMIVLGLSLTVTEGGTSLPFSDVPKPSNDLYPDDYVAVAAANGLVEGYGGGIFKPYIDIARAQVLTMVVRAAERFKPAAVPEPPSDWHGVLPTTDATHGKNIARAEYGGLLAGIDLSGFSLYGKATRGEVAQIVWNLRQK